MKKSLILSTVAASAWAISSAAGQVAFTAGNLVVLQAGADGGAALTSAAAPLFLKEIDITDGHVVQTIAVPATGASAITQSGSATSEGMLTLSADGKSVVFVGYRADAGTAAVVATASTTNPRVVAVVNCGGAIDTTTAFTDGYSANNIRSAVSSNGVDIWTAGTASTLGGIHYVTLGSTTSTYLNAGVPTNCRVVNIFSNQLYTSSASTPFIGVGTVGSGLPTTAGQTLTLLPGKGIPAGSSNYDYYFADASTLYVTDDRAVASGGGLQKWTFDGSNWTLQYTLNAGLANGLRNITGKTVAGTTTVWGTTGVGSAAAGNGIVVVTDSGASSSFAALGTGTGANTWFRGIDFVPSGCTTAGCYANCDQSTNVPVLTANDFQCFLNEFAGASSYANCDGSTTSPVLTANDFQCFLNAYAAGCT